VIIGSIEAARSFSHQRAYRSSASRSKRPASGSSRDQSIENRIIRRPSAFMCSMSASNKFQESQAFPAAWPLLRPERSHAAQLDWSRPPSTWYAAVAAPKRKLGGRSMAFAASRASAAVSAIHGSVRRP